MPNCTNSASKLNSIAKQRINGILRMLAALLVLLLLISPAAVAAVMNPALRETYARQTNNFSNRYLTADMPADQAMIQIIAFSDTCAPDGAALTVGLMFYMTVSQAEAAISGCGRNEFCYGFKLREEITPFLDASGFSPLKYMEPYERYRTNGAEMSDESRIEIQARMAPTLRRLVQVFADNHDWKEYALDEPQFLFFPPKAFSSSSDGTCQPAAK